MQLIKFMPREKAGWKMVEIESESGRVKGSISSTEILTSLAQ